MNNEQNHNFQDISREYPLVLASASPRRKRLLQKIGLPFRILPSHIEEIHSENDPAAFACGLAEKKALAVNSNAEKGWILGADTVVVLGKKILGKPKDRDDAHSMLELLSGKEHDVITGFCLIDPSGELCHSGYITTIVKIKRLSDEEITAYIDTGEPYGKAGGYAIQGMGSFMVEGINGSYSNVVGLPVCALIKALLASGALKRQPSPPRVDTPF